MLNREHRRVATRADVEAVVSPAFEHGGNYFDELWEYASVVERKVLSQVAAGTLETSNEHALAILCRRELLEVVNGVPRFQVPLIARWVRERSPFSAELRDEDTRSGKTL
ncbi:hypothetical protein [Candidatus Amarolinea dominans]|uniref:hypothetical protein n=1 Tax=Candidatus Amarolinea dominans TaxID=3140696 RepID=UPI001D485E32|nr:hypothetical protein [Anaerolineae bacterium]